MGVPITDPCSFLDKCVYMGFIYGDKRWKSSDGKRLYTWDWFHGEIEVYNKRGKHLGAYDCNGKLIKEAKNGRKIDV